MEKCRYFHIPIGNLPADPELYACDVFYGRYLLRENHVLWCSLTDTPDLGGKQVDDKRCSGYPIVTSVQQLLWLVFHVAFCFRFSVHDVDDPISVNVPGFYLSVCVDINVQYLVVNSILQV